MKKRLFLLLISSQLVVIIFFGIKIYQNKNVLSSVAIAPIKQEYINTVEVYGYNYFFEPKPNIVMNSINEWVPYKGTYTINKDTLNERFNYEVSKVPHTFRIITLGDSFTFGLYVDTKYNWPEQLEDILNTNCHEGKKFEVINLGMQGYDIGYSVLRYKLRGVKYSPDLLLWLLKDDDYMQINEVTLHKEQTYAKEMRKSGEFDRLVKEGIMYPSMVKAIQETEQELGRDVILDKQRDYIQSLFDLYKNPIVIMNFQNTSYEVSNFFKEVAVEREMTYLFNDLVDITKKKEDNFANDGHPTIQGHKAIAEDTYRYLIENKIISCY